VSAGETGGFYWEGAEDLTSLSEELKERLASPWWRSRTASYRRQVLLGRIDLMRAELVRRGSAALSPEKLVFMLMGEEERP
jgi:anti-sigma-K factor RsiG